MRGGPAMRIPLICATALCGALLVGCFNTVVAPADSRAETKSDTKKNDQPPETKKNDPTPSEKEAEPLGTVIGRVTWGGKAPPAEEKADTRKEPLCAKCNVLKEQFVVGKGGGVKNVFVWLQDATQDPKKPMIALPTHPSLREVKDKEVVIDQPCCKFEPHVLALREGQVLVGKNSSAIVHNMKWAGESDVNDGDNKLIPAGEKIKINDLKASLKPVAVECNIHPWMKGWVRVFNHPYFAVTGDDGKFDIKKAPAGKYRIVIWHEEGWVNGGKEGQPVEIKAGGITEVNGALRPPE
jgi:hypothetical protein